MLVVNEGGIQKSRHCCAAVSNLASFNLCIVGEKPNAGCVWPANTERKDKSALNENTQTRFCKESLYSTFNTCRLLVPNASQAPVCSRTGEGLVCLCSRVLSMPRSPEMGIARTVLHTDVIATTTFLQQSPDDGLGPDPVRVEARKRGCGLPATAADGGLDAATFTFRSVPLVSAGPRLFLDGATG